MHIAAAAAAGAAALGSPGGAGGRPGVMRGSRRAQRHVGRHHRRRGTLQQVGTLRVAHRRSVRVCVRLSLHYVSPVAWHQGFSKYQAIFQFISFQVYFSLNGFGNNE